MINDNTMILPFFHNPRTPPPVPHTSSPKSSSSGSSIEGFVLPLIPPPNDPLRIILDPHGHRQLPRVSDNALPVDHERVTSLSKYRIDVTAKCASCAELAIECEFSESGIPCAPCAVLAVPDCDFSDPYFLVANLAHRRDLYLHEERASLYAAAQNNQISPAQFEREYERSMNWFYAAAQGAITRFLINSRATASLALRGYRMLAESSVDAGLLSRFLTIAHESHMHPLVLQVVADRLHTLFASYLGTA
ncbi:hypothetical protein B0H13DRAFT_435624 [Mycena leptocephala]|nr:hypothetical protein B0H13DRAFT_435624 [Mycena leptocephala]